MLMHILKMCTNIENELENYDSFLRFYYENQQLIKLPHIKRDIFNKSPNALFFSKCLSCNNFLYKTLNKKQDLNAILSELQQYNIEILNNNITNMKTFLIISHLNYFDLPSYKDIFNFLLNLQTHLINNKIINEIFMINPLQNYKNLQETLVHKMVLFIFKSTDIKIILVNECSKTRPETIEEINKILQENYCTSISGHRGFQQTYKTLKET